VLGKDGRRGWIEVKTIAPQWQDDDDAWQRFEAIAAAFPDNARLVVDRAWGGAGVSSQEIKARWSFISRTIEVESKSALIPANEQGPVWLCFAPIGQPGMRMIWKILQTSTEPAFFERMIGHAMPWRVTWRKRDINSRNASRLPLSRPTA